MKKGSIKGELWVPALCEVCGTIFQTHMRVPGRRYGKIKLLNPPPVFCPKCNSPAIYKEEYLYLIDDAYKAISRRKVAELIELQLLLKPSLNHDMTPETYGGAKRHIETALPELASIRDFIPKTRMEAYTLIGVIFALLTFAITCLQSGEKPTKQQALSTVIVNYDPTPKQQIKRPPSITVKSNKTRRNETCPCGSGIKFKRCHGLPGTQNKN